ncbi:MAG: hypothetical protein ACP5DQ_10675 [Bacteroidales bacterium]
MDNKFFTFIKPYLSYIDNGHFFRKPFSWLYSLMAIINLIVPFYILYQAADNNNIFLTDPIIVVVFLLNWIIIAIVSWISFQLWWDRKSKVISTSIEGDDFVAIPVIAHLIQTIGEWLGTWIGIVGFWVALITRIFLWDEVPYYFRQLDLEFMGKGFLSVILMPICGFLIIVTTRFFAELYRVLASIANNTRKN